MNFLGAWHRAWEREWALLGHLFSCWAKRRDPCVGLLGCKHTPGADPTGAAELTLRKSIRLPELHI